MDKRHFVAAALMLASMLPAAAWGELVVNNKSNAKNGVALVPPPANTGAVSPLEQASTLREAKKTGRTLRCWQHGRLLYEDSGFKFDAERQPNAVQVHRTDGNSVVLFDQKDSFCILSK